MKLNEERIELLKNTEVIIHNPILKRNSDLLNQIMAKCLGYNPDLLGTAYYYTIIKELNNSYSWESLDNPKDLQKDLPVKAISWFFEEEINNILILI